MFLGHGDAAGAPVDIKSKHRPIRMILEVKKVKQKMIKVCASITNV